MLCALINEDLWFLASAAKFLDKDVQLGHDPRKIHAKPDGWSIDFFGDSGHWGLLVSPCGTQTFAGVGNVAQLTAVPRKPDLALIAGPGKNQRDVVCIYSACLSGQS